MKQILLYYKMYSRKIQILLSIFILIRNASAMSALPNNLAWNGGPMHSECEHTTNVLTNSDRHVKENVVAIKAATYKDEIYIITPRLRCGLLATVWRIVRGRRGVELQPYPETDTHVLADCEGIQNAIDFHLDYLGNLWVLDSGIVETLESPRCTCEPKVLVINTLLGKVTKRIDLSSVTEPTSTLQTLAVEYSLGGKTFVYISESSRGSVLVHDVSKQAGWSVTACAAAPGLQLTLARRAAHAVLILVRVPRSGLLELDTATLRRKSNPNPPIVFGEHTKPVMLLGSESHHVFLRHVDCADALSWDARDGYNASMLKLVHSPGPQLVTSSVSADPLKRYLMILDTNYAETVNENTPTYHRITYVGKW